MKSMARLLTFLIIFELILAPMPEVAPKLISKAMADDCPSGFQWDNTLNRCLTTEQVANVMNSVSNCNGDKACYKSNAENALKEGEQEGKIKAELANKSGLLGSGMKVAAIAVPLLLGVSMLRSAKKNGAKCGATSIYIMMGGGIAAFLGDTLATRQHKGRLKKIQKEWDEIIASSSNQTSSTPSTTTTSSSTVTATEGQSQAFEMLAKNEDSLAKAAKLKSMTYGIATLAFGAATVMSTLEAMRPLDPTTKCHTKPGSAAEAKASTEEAINTPAAEPAPVPKTTPALDQVTRVQTQEYKNILNAKDLASFVTLNSHLGRDTLSSPSYLEYEQNVELLKDSGIDKDPTVLVLAKKALMNALSDLSPIKSAVAADAATAISTKGAGAAETAKVSGMSKALFSPTTRAILSGVFTAWSAIMMMHARKQAKVAEERAAYLRKLKDTFNDASSAIGCSDAQRANPSVPSCYCYTSSGARNPDRSASTVCSTLFNGKSVSATETNYLTTGTTASVMGCITSSGTTDTTCSCRSSNSCLTSGASGITGIDTGSISALNSALTPLDQLGNGTLAAGTVSAAGAVNNAIRMLDSANKTAAKSTAGQELLNSKSKLANEIASGLMGAASGYSPSSSLGGGLSSLPSNPTAAALELEKELKGSPINAVSGGQGAIAAPTNSANEQLDFGLAGSETANPEAGKLAEVMGQNLDYGQNDINSGSSVNIFEVLSNRYQRSGMRRLFDEEGKTKADKPSLDEIHK